MNTYVSYTMFKQLYEAKALNIKKYALAGAAQWIEHQPANKRVAGLIPSQGTCLGCGPGPQYGVHEKQPYIDVSFPLSLPPLPL